MSRSFTLLLLFLVGALCCTSLALDPRASPRPGNPAFDGKDHLLSEADFRAILSVASTWLAQTHPRFHVRRVYVITGNTVEVYVRGRLTAEYGEDSDLHSVELQRAKKGWRIAGHNLERVPTID